MVVVDSVAGGTVVREILSGFRTSSFIEKNDDFLRFILTHFLSSNFSRRPVAHVLLVKGRCIRGVDRWSVMAANSCCAEVSQRMARITGPKK